MRIINIPEVLQVSFIQSFSVYRAWTENLWVGKERYRWKPPQNCTNGRQKAKAVFALSVKESAHAQWLGSFNTEPMFSLSCSTVYWSAQLFCVISLFLTREFICWCPKVTDMLVSVVCFFLFVFFNLNIVSIWFWCHADVLFKCTCNLFAHNKMLSGKSWFFFIPMQICFAFKWNNAITLCKDSVHSNELFL